MTNDAWEKDRIAHELFEQARAAFNEGRIEAEEGLKAPNGHWQPRRLEDALAREWRAVEQMEAAIELLRAGLPGSHACPAQGPVCRRG